MRNPDDSPFGLDAAMTDKFMEEAEAEVSAAYAGRLAPPAAILSLFYRKLSDFLAAQVPRDR